MQTLILSYKRVGYYCDLLMRKGLIEYDLANHTYVITSKGTEILSLYQELAGHLEPVDQMIKKYSYYINLGKPAMRHAQ